mmetsp:Transcript_27488/g.30010  ORF Transcript_27488/g.30010 Transcript_27488/m.30010 type:complete len:176 (+) Transcript_27488:3-530(+)
MNNNISNSNISDSGNKENISGKKMKIGSIRMIHVKPIEEPEEKQPIEDKDNRTISSNKSIPNTNTTNNNKNNSKNRSKEEKEKEKELKRLSSLRRSMEIQSSRKQYIDNLTMNVEELLQDVRRNRRQQHQQQQQYHNQKGALTSQSLSLPYNRPIIYLPSDSSDDEEDDEGDEIV